MVTMLKNIAIISHTLNSGGAERIAGLLSKELSKYYNVYLFLLNTENMVYEYGGTIVDIGQSGPFYEYHIKKYKDLYGIDVSISFLEPMNFANIRTWGREKVIISERCVQSLMNPPLIAEAYKIRKYYNFADEIVSCSDGVKYDLIQNYGINSKITTIYNFIDKEGIVSKARENLPKDAADFLDGAEYFVNVGRLHPQKNQRRLILQFSLFHAWHPEIKLLILGSGELEDELISYIGELDLPESVKIIPYTKNPFCYIAKAKALILASHYEGLPNAILEAMTLGCPVIATDCLAGPRELLMDEADYEKSLGKKLEIGKRGILVCDDAAEDEGTSRYMAEAMKLLCSSASLAETLRRSGRAYMEEYTNQRIVEQWISVIEGCVCKEKPDFFANEGSVLNAAEHIVIYGAGLVGKGMFLRLSKRYRIDSFVISRRKAGENELFGIPIREISEIGYAPENTAVVMGVGDKYQNDVLRTLEGQGFENIVFPYIESAVSAKAGIDEMTAEKHYFHEIAKWKEYFNVMLQWVFLSQKGMDIGQYLKKNGCHKIAIYGMADIGNCLAGQLLKSGHCKLLYGIDQGFPKLYHDIPCYKLENIEGLEKPDVIVVTLPHIYEEIKENIERTVKCKTLSITELVYDSYYDVEGK